MPNQADDLFAAKPEARLLHADGSNSTCTGAMRQTKRAARARIAFDLRTSPLRRAILDLRVVVDQPASVAVVIDSDTVHTFNGVAAGGSTLNSVSIDITRWTEPTRNTTAVVDFDFGDHDGVVSLFEDDSQCAPRLRQPVETHYAAPALAFFALCVILLISATLNGAGLLARIKTEFRALVVLGIAVATGYHLFGLPDLPAIRPRERMRRLFARTASLRVPVILVLLLLTIPSLWWSGRILATLLRRQAYTRYVERAIIGDTTAATEAFLAFPWRREGKILIERNAYGFRSSDNSRLRAYLRPIVTDRRVEAAAFSPESAYTSDLEPASGVSSDPAVWYVSLLLESGIPDSYPRGAKLLNGRKGDEARIQKAIIDLNLAHEKPDRQERVAQELERLLQQRDSARFRDSFLYQAGYDALATYSATRASRLAKACAPDCSDAQRRAVGEELDREVDRFRTVVEVRAEALQRDSPGWLRPPQKLDVYHLLSGATPGSNILGAQRAQSLIRNYAYYRCFAERVPPSDCDAGQLQAKIASKEFDSVAKWLAGTVQDDKLNKEIPTYLLEGWRY